MRSKTITIGFLGALAVTLGALGAHFLKEKMKLDPELLSGFETGVRYHMFHTVVMLALVAWNTSQKSKWLDWAYACFLWGIILFSGSLYFLCTRSLYNAEWLKVLGPVTPIGGLVLIAGWIMIAVHGFKIAKQD